MLSVLHVNCLPGRAGQSNNSQHCINLLEEHLAFAGRSWQHPARHGKPDEAKCPWTDASCTFKQPNTCTSTARINKLQLHTVWSNLTNIKLSNKSDIEEDAVYDSRFRNRKSKSSWSEVRQDQSYSRGGSCWKGLEAASGCGWDSVSGPGWL